MCAGQIAHRNRGRQNSTPPPSAHQCEAVAVAGERQTAAQQSVRVAAEQFAVHRLPRLSPTLALERALVK